MKVFQILICIGLCSHFISCKTYEIELAPDESDLSVMSFNLRYDEPADGENEWLNRREACIRMLQDIHPLIIGVQEAQQQQRDYLITHLPSYKQVGEINEYGYYGEYKTIFYDSSRFTLLETQTFWLSETPDRPSRGWDANNTRIVTWAKLQDIKQKRPIFVFNTHFDHKGKVAQQKSSELLHQKIQEIVPAGTPVFITGDFNMLIGSPRLRPLTKNYFSAQRFAQQSDNRKSFNAFGRWIFSRNIDFIFYQNAQAKAYQTITKDYNVPFISDHYPIISYFSYQ